MLRLRGIRVSIHSAEGDRGVDGRIGKRYRDSPRSVIEKPSVAEVIGNWRLTSAPTKKVCCVEPTFNHSSDAC